MPRNPRKRPRSCEVSQITSSGGVEVFSLDMVGGKAIKKRTFEVIFYNVPLPPKDDSPPDKDNSNNAPLTSALKAPKGPSRSVSVRVYFYSSFVLFN